MYLVLRLHRLLKANQQRYRICFVPDPVCWTDAPENFRDLKSQRVRWQHGLGQALALNRSLILNPRVTALELVASLCDELKIAYPKGTTSIKVLTDLLSAYLLDSHADGRRIVLDRGPHRFDNEGPVP